MVVMWMAWVGCEGPSDSGVVWWLEGRESETRLVCKGGGYNKDRVERGDEGDVRVWQGQTYFVEREERG